MLTNVSERCARVRMSTAFSNSLSAEYSRVFQFPHGGGASKNIVGQQGNIRRHAYEKNG